MKPAMSKPSTVRNRWLREVLKPVLPAFREVFVVSLFVNLLALTIPVFVLQVYDRVVFYSGLTTLAALAIGVMVAIMFDFILRQARSRILQRVAVRIDVVLGRRLFHKILSLPLRVLEARGATYWQTLFRDADVVRNLFSGPSAVLVTDLPFAVLFIIVIFIVAAPIAWVLLIMLPLFLLLAWRSGSVVDHALRDEKNASLNRDALLSEVVHGRTTIKALALDQAVKTDWEARHADTIERSMHRGSRGDTYVNLGFVLMMSTTVALVSVGALAIIAHKITLGSLIATTMLSNRIIGPFNQLVNTWRNLAGFKQSLDRLSEAFAAESEREQSALMMERPKGRISIENVSFAYGPDQKPVLDGIKLEIGPGGITGLVGRNGSGKTTLVKLLHGLYTPTAGRILLDGADIGQFSRRELSGWIGYVPQECFLFAGNIRDNIAKAHPDAEDEAILRAAQMAGVHQYVIDLPEGYATDIGEAGSRLSGGQRQRIAIARAMLSDPPVLLLDEASGNLDAEAEIALRDTLIGLAETHTIIVVTHTPALLRACSNIVVLDKGRVALAGPAPQVLPKIMGTSAGRPTSAVAQQPREAPAENEGEGRSEPPPPPLAKESA
ncbi:MAG: type I secretion system ATPase [Rhodospirillaceae bacterium]|nr:type I secretion system ATPase [Rhodospirillaceae bacterium]